ncbi:hypothetical protein ACWEKT_11965 [Nocardia takedensis]
MAVESPFGAYVAQAGSGALTVRMEPRVFLDLDAACQRFVDDLTVAMLDARALGEKQGWGLGEDDPRLTSAVELVNLFREKAFGGPDNAYDTLADFIAVATELQSLFTTLRETYARVDEDFARRLREIRI